MDRLEVHPERLHELRLLLKLTLVTLIASVMVIRGAPAMAHTELVQASPGPGATLDAPPAEVVLVFDGAVQPAADPIVVTDVDGTRVPMGDAIDREPTVVSVALAPLVAGDYTVAYRVVAGDGHVVEGTYQFTVSSVATTTAPTPTADAVATAPAPTKDDESPFGIALVALAAMIGLAGGLAAWIVGRRAPPT